MLSSAEQPAVSKKTEKEEQVVDLKVEHFKLISDKNSNSKPSVEQSAVSTRIEKTEQNTAGLDHKNDKSLVPKVTSFEVLGNKNDSLQLDGTFSCEITFPSN